MKLNTIKYNLMQFSKTESNFLAIEYEVVWMQVNSTEYKWMQVDADEWQKM
jgi:hypothetical protein